jgi:pimeloyl-ACP methyl ester carboxylesterase
MTTRNPLRYRSELRRAWERLAAVRTSTVTTPVGPIEYVDQGSGYPLLLVHGIFGGHDAALRLTRPEVLAGYRVIAPSRFGYLGTPMPARPSVALQADAHAALLGALGVDQALVFAASAGVTSALQLTIQYPSRVIGLVLQSSNVPGAHHDRQLLPRWIAARLWRSNLLMWLIRTYLSGVIAHSMMGVPKQLPLSDADRARLDEELDSIFPVDRRIDGVLFDAYIGNPTINYLPLEAVTAPTLVVHFRDDGGPPYASAVAMAQRIGHAQILTGEHGGHLGLGEHPEIPASIATFLREVTAGGSDASHAIR